MTYLVAALLTLGSTSVLTGCIDNDEPAGISALRTAKAELITAKKAVVEAEAARLKSEAALNEAKAEVEKANAEIKRAQAEQIKAATEAEKAKLEAEIKRLEAEAQEALNNALKAQYEAEAAYEKSRIEIAQAKAAMAKKMADALEYWYNRYDEAVTDYNTKYNVYIAAQRAYTAALAEAEKTAADAPEVTRDLEYAVVTAERELAASQAELDALNNALAEAEQMQPGDLQIKKADLEAELEAANQKKAELEVQKAEFVRENQGEFDKVTELKGAIDVLENEQIEISAFSYQFPEIGIPNYAGEREIIGKGYAFNVVADKSFNQIIGEWVPNGTYYANGYYNTVEGWLTNEIENLKRLMLDEDDQAWTSASINELTIEQKAREELYKEDEAWWEEAVAGYNEGKGADLTQYTGYTELGAAIDAFNASVEDLNAARVTLAAADAKVLEAWENLNWNIPEEANAYAIRNAAYNAAWEAYEAAMEQPRATRDAELKKLDDERSALQENTNLAFEKYWIAQNLANQYPDDANLKKDAEDAKKAWEALDTQLQTVNNAYSGKVDAVNATFNKAEAIASAARNVAFAEANKQFDETVREWGNTINDAALQAAYDEALEVQAEANSVFWNKYDDNGEVISKGLIPTTEELFWDVNYANADFMNNVLSNASSYVYTSSDIWDIYTSIWNTTGETETLPELAEFITMTSGQVKNLVLERSQALYGYLRWTNNEGTPNWEKYNDSFYSIPVEHLLPRTQADIDKIIQTMYPNAKSYEIANHYSELGSYGRYLATGHQIEVAKAVLANGPEIDNAILAISEQLTALEELKTAQEEKIAEAAEAFVTQKETLLAAMQPLEDEFEAVKNEQTQINRVLDAVNHALLDLGAGWTGENEVGDNNYAPSQAAIDAYIKYLKEQIETQEDDAFAKETAVVKAQKELADWNSEAINKAEVKKDALEDAELEMNQAKEILDSRKADLDKVIAYLETVNE